ncbi:MAG: GNAT family N-acetyltransferase [Ginsengibacter sp.]
MKATKDHIDVIHHLAHKIWPTAYGDILSKTQLQYMLEKFYNYSSLQNQLETLKHSFILVKNENEFVAFASYSSQIKSKGVFRLNKLYVLPSEQGKHVGKQMLDHIIDEIKKEAATSIQLNVNRFNKAIHFYKKQGFEIVREENIDIGEGYLMNDWIMEKKIW